MLKNEFLEMMQQDLATSNNELAKQVLMCFEDVLKDYPATTEIDSSKSCEDCYKKMHDEAKKNAKDGCYCFTPKMTKEFIVKYLGLETQPATNSVIVKLEDFI